MALGLAVVNIATLVIAGRPWGVTSAFALWGSKLLMTTGVDVASWAYWQPAARAADLHASVLHDVTSVMDIGIMLGAFAAAALAGRFRPVWRVPGPSLVAAIVGGILLGYGARIAFGCNIGAYFSGVASTSLHGWVWLAAAFSGNILGTRLRPCVRAGSVIVFDRIADKRIREAMLETELAAATDEPGPAVVRRTVAEARLKLDLVLDRARRHRASNDASLTG